MRQLAALTVLGALAVAGMAAPAHAHPFTIEFWPGNGISGEVGTTQVWVKYSEEVELDFSSLKVYDALGNQIDNRDTTHHTDDASLTVSTPPLEEGIYTVASKVLSRVDGHLVPDTLVFTVGNVVLEQGADVDDRELLYLPEAAARFPGLVGQSILVGSAIAALLIWGTQDRRRIQNDAEAVGRVHRSRLSGVLGASLIAILASNIAVLAVQTVRLGAFSPEALNTHFGQMWVMRMVITGALLALWFVIERRGIDRRALVVLIGLGAALLWTSSQIGHGAATGDPVPALLDYMHNWVAAVWIGGVAYLCMVLVPSISKADARDRMTAVMLPRFSAVFTVCLGVVIITGPLLMWFLDSDLGAITGSVYGKLIMAKLALAAGMVALGGYAQLSTVRTGGTAGAHGRLRRSVRIEMVMGVALLGVVAVLINGTLPGGELRPADAHEHQALRLTEFSGNTKFVVDVYPNVLGPNGIYVTATDLNGNPPPDQTGIRVKASNPGRNITPVPMDLEEAGNVDGVPEYSGEVTFGFAGEWVVEVESQREAGVNESVMFWIPVTADPGSLDIRTDGYALPLPAKPLYPIYHDGGVWISDPSAPRVWRFDTSQEAFESYEFDGGVSLFMDIDGNGRVWFTDPASERIGYVEGGAVTTIDVPRLEPADVENRLMFISVQKDVWVAAATKDAIMRYDPDSGEFEVFDIGLGSFPFFLATGPDGNVWFTATGGGFIGYIDPQTGEIVTFAPEGGLASPEFILFAGGMMWISEHSGDGLARFDPATGSFHRIPLDADGLPYGSALGPYGNIWVAQHVVDEVSVYSPTSGSQISAPVPSQGSFVQFVSSDDQGGVWLVEQQSNVLTRMGATYTPPTEILPRPSEEGGVLYTEAASPLMAAGILAASLFFVKSVWDARRLEREVP